MSQVSFDPYHKWLGIATSDQPPTHYQLLGISHLESDVDVIEYSTDRQMLALRTFETGPHGEVAKRIIREVSAASRCLLNPRKKRKYDRRLSSIAKVPELPATVPTPPPLPPSAHNHSQASPPLPPPVHGQSPGRSGPNSSADMIAPDLITRSVVVQRLGRYRPARTRDRIMFRGRKP